MLRARSLVTVCWAMFACYCSAQTSSSLTAVDVSKGYYGLKKVMQQYYEEGELPSNIDRLHSRDYDLVVCLSGGGFIGGWSSSGVDLHPFADLAGRIVIWRNDLRKLGYPEGVWRPMLIAFEDAQVKQLILEEPEVGKNENPPSEANLQRFEEQLRGALNQYRQQDPKLPKVTLEGGCGAGETAVRVRLQPPNGEVLFMPRMLYRYCRAQGLNADDPQSCDYWRRATDNVLYSVSGSYQFWARWPDGKSQNGVLDFSKYEDQSTVTFTKP